MNISALSTSERTQLVEQLWDSIREKSDEIEVTPEQLELLKARLAAYENDGDSGKTWEHVKDSIQSPLTTT